MWDRLVDENSLSNYITQKGLPEGRVLGIFFMIDSLALRPALLQNLRDWIAVLVNTVFPTLSVAIVIDLQCHPGSSVAKISQQIEQIENSLATSTKISKDAVVRIMLAETCDRLQQPQNLLRSTHPNQTKADVTGFYLYSWVIDALQTTPVDFSVALSSYFEILSIYKQFSRNASEPDSTNISRQQLITDLDAYASLLLRAENRSPHLYRQLLEFTEQYKPSSLHELLAVYAYSQSTEAYRQAISFSCSYGTVYSDILIDVFLDGIDNNATQAAFAQSFDAPSNSWLTPTKEYFIDRLGLALIRRIDGDRDFQPLIEKIQHRLSPQVKEVANFRLGKCSKEDLMNRMDRDPRLLVCLISSIAEADSWIDFLHTSQYRWREHYM